LETAVRRAFQGIGQAEISALLLGVMHFRLGLTDFIIRLLTFFDGDQDRFFTGLR